MAIIKCKMCGGDMEISADKTFGTCEYCGSTMTLPKVSDEQRAAAFNRGNHFRRAGEFDKALGVYERIVAEDDTDAEAHWCCALCRFGIDYVEDPATYEWLPTCHRASFDSFLEDVDYLAALEHSDGITRRQYQKDAAKIAEVQRGILATSQNTEPYDIFISYKELDANGERTRDSVLAQDIYYQLTEQGRRVFFSRVSLEDIPGTQYEPYIFAALNSAKVMIVVGTSAENLNAVWVKNEWSRYLAMMRKDKSKLLIPCYRDMDPYDLPEPLAVLMSFDMGKIGFIQDLTRGVNKVLDAGVQKKEEPVRETVVVKSEGGANTEALLKRGYMALDDRSWSDAKSYFDRVLDMDAECGAAYLGLFLSDKQCSTADEYAAERTKALPPPQTEVLEACPEQSERINKFIQENTIQGYLSQDEIDPLFFFDCSYKSRVNWLRSLQKKELESLSQERVLTRAKKYASDETAEQIKSMVGKIKSFYDAAIAKAEAKDKANIARLTANYNAHLEEAEANAKRLHDEAAERRERNYIAACKKADTATTEAEFRDAAGMFERSNLVIGDYKDSCERAQYCIDKYNELAEKHKNEEREAAYIEACKKADAASTEGEYLGAKNMFLRDPHYKDSADRAEICNAKYTELVKKRVEKRKEEERKLAEKKAKARKKRFITGTSVIAAIIAVFLLTTKLIIPSIHYNKAEALLAEGDKLHAVKEMHAAGGFRGAREQSITIMEQISPSRSISVYYHTVGLKSDGTVVAVGDNVFGRYDVSGWKDIVAVAAGDYHTVGLKSDGTVVAVGNNEYGQCDVRGWKDIVAVSAGNSHTVGLQSDGTVVAVGYNEYGQCGVGKWTDIVAVTAGGYYTVGLKSDGTVVAVGSNSSGQCDVRKWKDIVAVAAGFSHTVGLKSDGTVVAVGGNWNGQCDVSGWTDIVAVAAGGNHTVGLKSDGTVVAVGDNKYGQCDVSEWTDIVAVAAGWSHTVGLKSDGTVVAVGDNDDGQYDVSGWKDIKIPER